LDFLWDFFQWALGPQWRWSAPTALWLLLFFASPWGRSLAGNDADRKRWIGFLTQDRGKRRHQRVMTRLLDAVDTRLSGPEIEAEKSGCKGVELRPAYPDDASGRGLPDPQLCSAMDRRQSAAVYWQRIESTTPPYGDVNITRRAKDQRDRRVA
jgi:hypothetical protein